MPLPTDQPARDISLFAMKYGRRPRDDFELDVARAAKLLPSPAAASKGVKA